MTEFEKIYRDYFDDVYFYIRRLSGDENIAEEITSEAFFKAMRSISGLLLAHSIWRLKKEIKKINK